MNELQALVDGMNAQWQKERADTQMTLGELIEYLESIPPESVVQGISGAHSYRGYYSDLAFVGDGIAATAADALDVCREAMGKVFEGYKGGDFMMGGNTPIWQAAYGCCGLRIMALNSDGSPELEQDNEDD